MLMVPDVYKRQPLFITYYTLYPLAGGRIADYSDVYGFDVVIFDMLRKIGRAHV